MVAGKHGAGAVVQSLKHPGPQEARRGLGGWVCCGLLKPQSSTPPSIPSDTLSPTRLHFLIFSKWSTKLGPHIQPYKSMGTILIQTSTFTIWPLRRHISLFTHHLPIIYPASSRPRVHSHLTHPSRALHVDLRSCAQTHFLLRGRWVSCLGWVEEEAVYIRT